MTHDALPSTPGQTVGPFFHFGLDYPAAPEVVGPDAVGAVRLHGRVLDGAGEGIPDALVEIWQAAADGSVPTEPGHLQRDGSFTGFGRSCTDADGRYWFRTLEPSAMDGSAAFFAVAVFARGLLDVLFTRAYLPGVDPDRDPLLSRLSPQRRETLLVSRESEGSLLFDIHLQGEAETVFLDLGPGRDA